MPSEGLQRCCPSSGSLRAVIAIPVQNEAQLIGACIDALAAQSYLSPGAIGVLFFLNNCDDGTGLVVRRRIVSFPWPVRVIEIIHRDATAGWARKEAMDAAARWLGEAKVDHGVILTTDADSRVALDWVKRNLDHIETGADAVAGQYVMDQDDIDALPAAMRARRSLEAAYGALLAQIDSRFDPEPTDPYPGHRIASGTSLAVRRSSYIASGGVPPLTTGEDRALVEALHAIDAHVCYASDIVVQTSGRLEGRATGGAADTMRVRCNDPDSVCDPRLEALPRSVWRALTRRRLKRAYDKQGPKAFYFRCVGLGVPSSALAAIASVWTFAKAYQIIEAECPRFAFKPLRPSKLPLNIALAQSLLGGLDLIQSMRRVARPAGTKPPASAARDGQRLQQTV